MNNLLRHPEIFAKLKDEIRSTFKAESEIRLEIANNLPYLNACIEENLRVFPPAPIGFLRSVQKGGDLIDGHFIPENVSTSWPCLYVNSILTPCCRRLYQSALGAHITLQRTFETQTPLSPNDGSKMASSPGTRSLQVGRFQWAPEAASGRSKSKLIHLWLVD